MNDFDRDQSSFRFGGEWSEFVPIAITNAFLTLITLGFYRFWAIARERKYLWSKTQFIDDRLEWNGTGLELFLGAIIAFILVGIPLFALNFLIQSFLLQGQSLLAGLAVTALYFMIIYLSGFAIFRGLRYRLSRTYWHGIRGGTDDPGFRYGLSYMWKTLAGLVTLGGLIPWSSAALWKERWEMMSFGPHQFESSPRWQVLMKRFVLFYLAPLLIVVGSIFAGFSFGDLPSEGESAGVGLAGIFLFVFFAFYILLPALALAYLALYAREMVGSLKLDTLSFSFRARTLDWFILFLGNLGLMVLAAVVGMIALSIFGGGLAAFSGFVDPSAMEEGSAMPAVAIGAVFVAILSFAIPFMLIGPFIRFRNWAFYIKYLETDGQIDVARLTQSNTADVKQGEGLLDAFDMGAI